MSASDQVAHRQTFDSLPACDAEPVSDEPGAKAALFSRILVPVDGRLPARRAVETAGRLALREGAELALLAVADVRLTYTSEAGIPPSELMASLLREARANLINASLYLPRALHADELVREGQPADEIVAAAREWQADLIVLGREGHAGVGRLLANGVAEAVARRAPCPVLIVRCASQSVTGTAAAGDGQRAGRR